MFSLISLPVPSQRMTILRPVNSVIVFPPPPSLFRLRSSSYGGQVELRRDKPSAVIARSVSDEAIQPFVRRDGLLPPSPVELRRTSRFARNDGKASKPTPLPLRRLPALVVLQQRLPSAARDA